MNEQEQQIRIAIVDDHEMFRAGVIATLQPHFDIVGQAADVEGSVAMIAQTKPDVVLLDVHVPGGEGGGGAEILVKSRAYSPNTVFLALSVSDSPQDVGSVIRAGAQGYVTKTISGDDLISSIKQVHEGYAVFSPKLAGFVLSAFQNGSPAGMGGPASGPIHDDELDRLSNREQEVMRLIARGYTYKEVAAELFISIKTVETHVSSVLRKLQLSNRTELTRWADDRAKTRHARFVESIAGGDCPGFRFRRAFAAITGRASDDLRHYAIAVYRKSAAFVGTVAFAGISVSSVPYTRFDDPVLHHVRT